MDWSSAFAYCHDHFNGRGRLAVIRNREEQGALANYLQTVIGQ